MRHFLCDDDLSPAEQAEVLELAAAMKADPYGFKPLAGPQTVAIMFDKSSTRTRVSFCVGVADLGGNPLVMESSSTQAGRGEPIADTARVLGRMTSAVVWRTYNQVDLETMAEYSGVPVIISLSDDFHPCQILADWLTIKEHKGDLAGLTVAYVGDGANNMGQSYVLGAATAGMHIRIGAPDGYQPADAVVADALAIASETGGSVMLTNDPIEAVARASPTRGYRWAKKTKRQNESRYSATTQSLPNC